MSLEYHKDGEKVECKPLFGRGKVGQIVVHTHVNFNGCDLTQHPIAAYPQPSFFIIKARRGDEGHNYEYDLQDSDGKIITIGTDAAYIYDANDWGMWQIGHFDEKTARKDNQIERLIGMRDMLKDILTNQGFRIVTQEQANQLGL